MIPHLVLLFAPAVLLGLGWVALFWPRGVPQHWLLRTALSIGAGAGITSLTFFAWGLGVDSSWILYFLLEWTAGLGLCAWAIGRWWREKHRIRLPDWRVWMGLVIIGSAILVVMAFLWRYSLIWPSGGYDGVVIWNMRARFLFFNETITGGASWDPAFSPLLNWKIHPDYPLLLPLSVARLWRAIGDAAPPASSFVSLSFAAGLLSLLFAGLTARRSVGAGGMGLLFLAGAPLLATAVGGQTADVPLAFFFLAACILFERAMIEDRETYLILAGFFTSLAAWTKNEGLLFFLVSAAVILIAHRRKPQAGLLFLGGAALPLAALVYFKLRLAPASDLFEAQTITGWMARAGEPERFGLISVYLAKAILYPAKHALPLLVLLAVGLPLWFLRGSEGERRGQAAVAWIMGLTWLGYFGVYLLTPHDLQWHLDTSADRLVLQWLPVGLYLLLGAMRRPEDIFQNALTVFRRR